MIRHARVGTGGNGVFEVTMAPAFSQAASDDCIGRTPLLLSFLVFGVWDGGMRRYPFYLLDTPPTLAASLVNATLL